MKRLVVLLVCLMRTCSPLPAQETLSSEQPMVPLQTCLDELTLFETLAHEQVTQLTTLFQEQVTKLENAYAERVRTVAVEAAAGAARPLLVELAGVKAEGAVYKRMLLRWQAGGWAGMGGSAALAVLATVLAVR